MARNIIISTSIDLIRVAPENLIFISSDGNYSTLFYADGESRVVTLQIGVIEEMISTQLGSAGNVFIRIGRSLIINRSYIDYINIPRQQLVLSDRNRFNHSVPASKEALRQLKELVENE